MNNKRPITLTVCWIVAVVLGLSVQSFANNESEAIIKAEQHFQKANELHILAEYDAAIAEYQTVISLSPNSKIAQNAQYWIGQLYFESKRFDAALSAFQKLLDEYPASGTIPATTLMIERVQQAKKNKSLFEAVKKANIEQVKLLIAEGADIDAKWGDTSTTEKENIADDTPLCYAVDSNNMDLVKLLVEAGADVNAGSWPPLCWAVDKNNTAIAEYLIDHGANPNFSSYWGPLHETINISNSSKMAELLIARGADINDGYWPLLYNSVRQKRRDLFDLSIERGADVNTSDKWEYTPLYFAVHNDDLDYLKILIANGAKVDTKCPRGETALISGAIAGRTQAVRLLLEAGADIGAKNDRGQTALYAMLDIRNSDYTNSLQSKDTVELLLAKGTDVNLKDKNGRTPLNLAAESADRDIVELLLDKGARINEKDDESRFTALHHAARFGNKNAAEVLIARGADINAKDKQGHTPLYFAVNHDHKVAELLINKGADSSIRTESGQTLLESAQQRKEMESTVPDLIFDGDPNSWFGLRMVCGDVDGDGYDDILIGATYFNIYDKNKPGRAYLFYGGPDIDTTADLIFERQNEDDHFGAGIACGDIDNDGYEDIIIGALGYNENRGRAYLYWGSDRTSMDANPDKIFTGENEKGSRFGMNSAVYDIDNDGYDDIILGAYWYPDDGTGRAYLYHGNTKELMDTSYDLIFTAEKPGDRFGYKISCGDVDNDGYGDIVFGSANDLAYLYYGNSKSNMDTKADVIFEAKSKSPGFGQGIVCVDQNKDGYDDVIIGTRDYNDDKCRTYLFYGSSKGNLDADPDMIFNGEVEVGFSHVREVCADIDGDNVNDLVIGASGSGHLVGRVYVYWGNELAGSNPKPGRILTGENPNDCFGLGLACGDVNNDGFDDLIVGACGYKAGAKQGRAYKLHGNPARYRVFWAGANQGRAYLYYGGPKDK